MDQDAKNHELQTSSDSLLPGKKLQGSVFHSQDVPRSPGVYVFRNQTGEVIYVGKAKNLRNRMRSYFMASTLQKSDPRRRALIHSIASYQTFEVETEAEALLLESQFIKQYHPRYNVTLRDDKRFLHICIDLTETFPRLRFARIRREDGCLYFGPFPQATALRETVRMLEIRFGLRSCKTTEPTLETRQHCMEHVIRDCSSPCLGTISPENYRSRLDQALAVLKGEAPAAVLAAEIQKKMKEYAGDLNFEEAARLRDILEHLKTVMEPTRRFVNQTMNSRNSLSNREGVEDLQKALGLIKPPLYMECFDMSNISGSLAVGSMVCFRNGRPSTGEYRRYRIRSTQANDDTAFMREVLTRRYTRLLKEKLPLPDLIVLDGGPGQLHVGLKVFQEISMPPIPLLGLAKQQELLYLPGRTEPVALPFENPGLKMLQALRDEAHRFANAYHRELRNKRISNSLLADIPGIGCKRQISLLKTFGSVKNIVEKTPQELATTLPGLGVKTAEKILTYLRSHLKNQ
ncbi:MAG: excinuclease ABC subunit UvrC [Lentisphaeria bacterium]